MLEATPSDSRGLQGLKAAVHSICQLKRSCDCHRASTNGSDSIYLFACAGTRRRPHQRASLLSSRVPEFQLMIDHCRLGGLHLAGRGCVCAEWLAGLFIQTPDGSCLVFVPNKILFLSLIPSRDTRCSPPVSVSLLLPAPPDLCYTTAAEWNNQSTAIPPTPPVSCLTVCHLILISMGVSGRHPYIIKALLVGKSNSAVDRSGYRLCRCQRRIPF